MAPVAEQPYLWRIKHPLRCRYRTYARASIAHGTRDDASVRQVKPILPCRYPTRTFLRANRTEGESRAGMYCAKSEERNSERASEESPEVPKSYPCRVCPLLTYGIAAPPHHLTITNAPSPADPRSTHPRSPFPHPQVSPAPRSTNLGALAKSLFSRFFACCDKLDQAIAGYIHTTSHANPIHNFPRSTRSPMDMVRKEVIG